MSTERGLFYPSRLKSSPIFSTRCRRAGSSASQAALSASEPSCSRNRAAAVRLRDCSFKPDAIASSWRAISSPSTRLGNGGQRVRIGLRGVRLDHAGHQRGQRGDLLLTVPDIAEHPEVGNAGRGAPAEHGRGGHQLEHLDGPAVRKRHAQVANLGDDVGVALGIAGELDLVDPSGQLAKVIRRDGRLDRARLLQVPAGREQARHLLAPEIVDMAAEQEPVEQGSQAPRLRADGSTPRTATSSGN